MQRSGMRAFAALALAALPSASVLSWTAALHAADGEHHRGASTRPADALRLDLALHGHGHDDGTPPHGHPLLLGGATPLPGRTLLLAEATLGAAPEIPGLVSPRLRLLSLAGSAHDPPRCFATPSVLRV